MKSNMDKLTGASLDIEQAEHNKLYAIFPQCFTDGKLDIDKLLNLCGEYIHEDFEKYKFEWKGKAECYRIAAKRSTGTLRPAVEESVNFHTTKNLYIEGDNLEVLKLLQTSYFRKVKMIYIDPPYNTGNDFIYNDDFTNPIAHYKEITSQATKSNPETMGRFHTAWLNMMYPRLRLAHNLLRDDGVIFISIDDNEVHNLRKICDEIFGEENFIGQFVVGSTPNARDYGHIGKMHEYILFYGKNINATTTFMLPEIDKTFKYTDAGGGYNIHPLYNSNEAFTNENRPNLFYPFYLYLDEKLENNFYKIGLEKRENAIEIYPPKSQKNGVQFVWRWGKEKALENMNIEIIGYKTIDGEYRIVQKMRHDEKLIRSLLLEKSFTSRRGTAEMENLLEGKIFSFPKPIELVKHLVAAGTEKDDIILDFFSGSATAAHAVMQLNAEDGNNRRFIMVQLPEVTDEKSEAYKAGYKNICEIGKERISRVGKKIIDNYNVDIGFRTLKLDTSNLTAWDASLITDNNLQTLYDRIDTLEQTIKPNRTHLDIIFEVMLKTGVPLDYVVSQITAGTKTCYSIGSKLFKTNEDCQLLICLEKGITPEDITAMCNIATKIIAAEEAFKDDTALSNAHYILRDRDVEMKLL